MEAIILAKPTESTTRELWLIDTTIHMVQLDGLPTHILKGALLVKVS